MPCLAVMRYAPAMLRRALLILPLAAFAPPPVLRGDAAAPWLARLRAGGFVLFLRHTDTRGTGCDTTTDWRDAARQRHLSEAGRAQARAIGAALGGLPLERPVRASPVLRAFETALLAFGDAAADERLLSDEFAGRRMADVQRALIAEAPPAGLNRALVGHMGSTMSPPGRSIRQAEFPEGGLMIWQDGAPLATLELAPLPGGGAHGCG